MSEGEDWREVYKRIFGALQRQKKETFYREVEYSGYEKIYSTYPMIEQKIGRKKPDEYLITSYSVFHWAYRPRDSPTYRYFNGPFELGPNFYMQRWYKYFRDNSPLVKIVSESRERGWDDFEDPYRLVYWRYNAIMDDEEAYVDKIMEEMMAEEYHSKLEKSWLHFLRDYYDPLRYIWPILQMHASYLIQMTPGSTLGFLFSFIAMDYLRRVHRIAMLTKMLDLTFPKLGFGINARKQWEEAEVFQPARETLEKMLVSYDYSEALVSYTLAVKYLLDTLLIDGVGDLAERNGDIRLKLIHESFSRDSKRHREQVQAIFKYIISSSPEKTTPIINSILEKWIPMAYKAVDGFRNMFEEYPANKIDFRKIKDEIINSHRDYLESLGIKVQHI